MTHCMSVFILENVPQIVSEYIIMPKICKMYVYYNTRVKLYFSKLATNYVAQHVSMYIYIYTLYIYYIIHYIYILYYIYIYILYIYIIYTFYIYIYIYIYISYYVYIMYIYILCMYVYVMYIYIYIQYVQIRMTTLSLGSYKYGTFPSPQDFGRDCRGLLQVGIHHSVGEKITMDPQQLTSKSHGKAGYPLVN